MGIGIRFSEMTQSDNVVKKPQINTTILTQIENNIKICLNRPMYFYMYICYYTQFCVNIVDFI